MKTNLFVQWEHINWSRVSLVMAAVATVWIGLSEVVPEEYFKPVMILLTALQSGITVIMRGSVYVEDRVNPIHKHLTQHSSSGG